MQPLDEQTQLLREIRDLLLVVAEPALAKRDQARRASLRETVGHGKTKNARAVLLMDGKRTQAVLCKESGVDQGNLSRLVKRLREKGLVKADEKHPELVITIPPNFFEAPEDDDV